MSHERESKYRFLVHAWLGMAKSGYSGHTVSKESNLALKLLIFLSSRGSTA